jgi:hypothetical protein
MRPQEWLSLEQEKGKGEDEQTKKPDPVSPKDV